MEEHPSRVKERERERIELEAEKKREAARLVVGNRQHRRRLAAFERRRGYANTNS